MPRAPIPNQELQTFKEAEEDVNLMVSKGIPVTNLRELQEDWSLYPTNAPDFVDDGKQHMYLVNIFNSPTNVNVKLCRQTLGVGGLMNFVKVALNVIPDQTAAVYAVLAIPAVANAIASATVVP